MLDCSTVESYVVSIPQLYRPNVYGGQLPGLTIGQLKRPGSSTLAFVVGGRCALCCSPFLQSTLVRYPERLTPQTKLDPSLARQEVWSV
jgi:hypothetical protein